MLRFCVRVCRPNRLRCCEVALGPGRFCGAKLFDEGFVSVLSEGIESTQGMSRCYSGLEMPPPPPCHLPNLPLVAAIDRSGIHVIWSVSVFAALAHSQFDCVKAALTGRDNGGLEFLQGCEAVGFFEVSIHMCCMFFCAAACWQQQQKQQPWAGAPAHHQGHQ